MELSQLQQQVLTEGAKLIRPRKEPRVKGEPIQYDVKPLFVGNNRGWVLLDHTTANALQTCYSALSDTNKAKWDSIPVMRPIDFAWQHLN